MRGIKIIFVTENGLYILYRMGWYDIDDGGIHKTLMKTSVTDKESYFDEIIFFCTRFQPLNHFKKYIYIQLYCSEAISK